MKKILLVLALFLVPIIHGTMQPQVEAGSAQVLVGANAVTLASSKISLADSYAFFDFGTDNSTAITPFIGETIEICNTSNKLWCIRGIIGTDGSNETTTGALNVSTMKNAQGWPFSTFDGESATGFHVVATGQAYSYAGTADEISIVSGRLYKISYTYSKTSGTDPVDTSFVNDVGDASIGPKRTPTAGANIHICIPYVTTIASYEWGGQNLANPTEFTIADLDVRGITSPSATGFWIKKTLGGTDGAGWSTKHASFDPNQASGFTWHIISSNDLGDQSASGTVSSGDVHMVTDADNASITITGTDFASYAGVDAYTPPTGMSLWLKADAGCYTNDNATTACSADGGHVAVWQDQSGNANHVTQTTDIYRPLYKTNIVGALPAIRFDGSNDRLTNATFSQAQPIAIYYVMKSGASGYQTLWDNSSTGRNVVYLNGSTEYTLSAGSTVLITLPSYSDKKLMAFTYNAASSYFYLNGIGRAGILSIGNNLMGNPFIIGANYINDSLAGDIYEIIIYPSIHTDIQRSQTERYLAGKWGISYNPTVPSIPPCEYLIVLYDSSGRAAMGYAGAAYNTTGLKLFSTANGTTQSLTRSDAGFDKDAVTSWKVYRAY